MGAAKTRPPGRVDGMGSASALYQSKTDVQSLFSTMKHGLSFSTNKGRGSEGHIPTVHYLTPVVAWGNKCLLFFANEETVMLRIQYSSH